MKRIFAIRIDKTFPIKTSSFLASGVLLLAVYGNANSAVSPGSSTDKGWDMEALKRRGIPLEQLDNFDKLSEIPHGTNLVDITLNGDFVGSFQIEVNDQGRICFTQELFDAIDITAPEASSASGCYDWVGEQHEVSVEWQSETQTVSIVVPQDWLQMRENRATYGGSAAHINYNYYSTMNSGQSGSRRYSWLSLSSGINIANWMLRSEQNVEETDGRISSTIDSTYMEHFFSRLNKIFQIGEINTRNTLFALGSIKGIQFFPDDAQPGHRDGNGVVVRGIANTPQARVEVRQYDQLIYSTLVPAGPFNLTHIPVHNLNSELHVSVIETSGEPQQFIVPTTQLMATSIPEPMGLSLSMGRVIRNGDDTGAPAILTMDRSWRPINSLSLRTGALLNGNYQSAVTALSGRPASLPGHVLTFQAMLTQSRYQHKTTAQLRFYSSHSLTKRLSLSLGINKNTPGFTTLQQAQRRAKDTVQSDDNTDNTEFSIGLNWSSDWLGSLSFSHSRTRSYRNNGQWRNYMLNWNRRFDSGLLLTASAGQSSGGRNKNKNVNINFSWPLGKSYFRHYYRTHNHKSVVGSEVNMPLTPNNSFQFGVEQSNSDYNRSLQTSLSNDLRYTNLNLNMQMDNQHNRGYGINGNGAIVAHSKGVTFSKNSVQDTYALLSLNQPLAGVLVNTPGGTAWTDWRGMAVIPSLTPWQDNSVDIDVDRLPRNIDLANGHRSLRPARGSVKNLQISLLTGSRVLMNITLLSGKLLPKGSTLWTDDNIVAEAVDEGVVFISNAEKQGKYLVKIAHSSDECSISYTLDSEDEPDSLYQQLALVCQ